MKSTIFTWAIALSAFLSACQSNKNDMKKNESEEKIEIMTAKRTGDINPDVQYTVLQNYYIKNTVTEISNPKIDTEEKFNEIFSPATTMGKEGKPTEINFDKNFVIAVMLSATDFVTTIEPIELVGLNSETMKRLSFVYKVNQGEKQSFQTTPQIAISVDKFYADFEIDLLQE